MQTVLPHRVGRNRRIGQRIQTPTIALGACRPDEPKTGSTRTSVLPANKPHTGSPVFTPEYLSRSQTNSKRFLLGHATRRDPAQATALEMAWAFFGGRRICAADALAPEDTVSLKQTHANGGQPCVSTGPCQIAEPLAGER